MLIINKQALTQAALEMKRQETLQSCMLLHCLDQLDDIHRKLSTIFNNDQAPIARTTFLNVLMNDWEWEKVLIDQQLTDWHAEARQQIEQINSGD